jgi:sugar phosphate isomerase/epimerase
MAAAVPAVCAATAAARAADGPNRMGVCIHSYGSHWGAGRSGNPQAKFKDALSFLEYCHTLGAGGVQVGLGSRPEEAARVRARAEATGTYVEGIVSLPRRDANVDRLEAEIRTAKEAGAGVVRAVLLGGRRYETFNSDGAFREFTEQSRKTLESAEPVVRRHKVRLAIENHKDYLVPELLEQIKHVSSEFVGVCVDTGNSIALLEDPQAVVEGLAPWAATTHFKDMAVQEYPDGFLLSEVPLGEGFLDLPAVVAALRKANPAIRFNLEMITRDPLQVPCLTEKYWATFEAVAGRQLARALARVRAKASKAPLPRVTGKSPEERMKFEDDNVRASFGFARVKLGL